MQWVIRSCGYKNKIYNFVKDIDDAFLIGDYLLNLFDKEA